MGRAYLFLIISLLVVQNSFAQGIEGVYQVIIKKQQEKQNQRWTLLDWLGTKKKMALMDQWLAMNSASSSLFEFSLEASKGDLDFANGGPLNEKSFERFSSSVYIKFFGLSFIKEKIGPDISSTSIQGNLILLGSSNQSTNIQAFYGVRKLSYLDQELSPSYWGARVNLYILPFMGGFYDYRKYLSKSDGAYSLNDGERHEFGGFVEFWLLRMKASIIREQLSFSGPVISGRPNWSGALIGVELFF